MSLLTNECGVCRHNLATWVFGSFNPGGRALPKASREAEARKLLQEADRNGDGELDFEEFAGWFTQTCESIQKLRRGQERRTSSGSPSPRSWWRGRRD